MEHLSFERIGDIGIVKINRPKVLNALNSKVIEELDSLLDAVSIREGFSVIILGSGEHFAAGADIKQMVNLNEEEASAFSFGPVFDKLANLPVPTIAAIEGFALGGGLELALACDLLIASRTAKMGFPEINLGIMPGAGGTVRTPRLIGAAKAKELIFLGNTIDADRAEQLGLINKVVEPETLMESAMEWARKLSKKAPVALQSAKQTIQAGLDKAELAEAMKLETNNWAALFRTEDQKEGMTAFMEKRKPTYKGK